MAARRCHAYVHYTVSLVAVLVSLMLASADAALKWNKGGDLCFALTEDRSRAAIGLCPKDASTASAYFIQATDKAMLIKGNTDKDYLADASLIDPARVEKSSGIAFDELECCGPSMCHIVDSNLGDTVCNKPVRPTTGKYSWLMNSLKFGDDDNGGWASVGYYLSRGPIKSNVNMYFIDVVNGEPTFRMVCANGWDRNFALNKSQSIQRWVWDQQNWQGGKALMKNNTGSPPICGPDGDFKVGTVKFSLYSEFFGPYMGQLMRENKWVALRVNVALVGIERKSIYFNNDPAKTLESLNGESISRITAVDSNNLLIEFDFQKKFYSGVLLSESGLNRPAAPDSEAEVIIKASKHADADKFFLDYLFPIDDKLKAVDGSPSTGNARWLSYDPTITTRSLTVPVLAPTPTPTPTTPGTFTHVVKLAVTLPITAAEFNNEKQAKYKEAIASAAGAAPADVSIDKISSIKTAGRRLLGESIRVDTSIKVADKSTGEGMVAKLSQDSINRELAKINLPASTAMEKATVEEAVSKSSASSVAGTPASLAAACTLAMLLTAQSTSN